MIEYLLCASTRNDIPLRMRIAQRAQRRNK